MRRYKETKLNLRRKKIISQWLQGETIELPATAQNALGFKFSDEILLVTHSSRVVIHEGGYYNMARLEDDKVVVNYGPSDKKLKISPSLLLTIREIIIESAENLKIEVVLQNVPLNLSDDALRYEEGQPWVCDPELGYPIRLLTGWLGTKTLWRSVLYHIVPPVDKDKYSGEKGIPKYKEALEGLLERTIKRVKGLEALYPDAESFKLVRSMEGLADISKIGKHPDTSSAQLLSYKRYLALFRLSLVGVSAKDDEGAKGLDAEMATLYKFFGGKEDTRPFYKRGYWSLFTLWRHPEQAPRFLSSGDLSEQVARFILTKGF